MTLLLENRTCIVTGGAGSIGLASARLFLEHGARVMLVDLKTADLERARSALTAADVAESRIAICVADVTRAARHDAGPVLQEQCHASASAKFCSPAISGAAIPPASGPNLASNAIATAAASATTANARP